MNKQLTINVIKISMLNRFTLLAITMIIANSAIAQSGSTATQTVHIQVAPAIQIGNGNNGNGNGNHGNGNHGNGNNGNGNGNYGNGNNGNGNGNNNHKQSGGNRHTDNTHEFTVNSNKEFIISVSTPNGDGENILMALANNNTGGKANPVFGEKYAPVGVNSQDILMDCAYGNKRNFTVQYQTKAATQNAKRVTKADIIYTATQP